MSTEQNITRYMRLHYTDQGLAILLAHAEDGKLAFHSCCCFAGIPSAIHALQGAHPGLVDRNFSAGHDENIDVPWSAMSSAFCELGDDDQARRENIIPLIKAEIERRDRERSSSLSESLATVGVTSNA